MTDQQQAPEAPRIEFPCAYPIRVMGETTPDFKDFVCRVMKKHDPDFNGEATVRDSRTAKYLSVMVTITATGEEQLKAIFEELKASGRIKMVL